MEDSDDEEKILLLDQLENESTQPLAPNGRKFVEEVLNDHNNTNCCENFHYFDSQDHGCPPEILEDTRFYPYFKDCVGVVDGMHIPVMVGVDEQGPFRNRYGVLSQNVMAACSFGWQFQYVLAGWEGSATDSCVLNAALTRHSKLHVAEGKFYLVDEDYRNTPGFLAPYPGVRCQLSEFSGADDLQNAQELFNFRHSLLRSTIESTFKIWKARFPILTAAPLYPLQTQVKLVIATCILHNYIRKEKGEDWLFYMCEDGLRQQIEPTATGAEKEPMAHMSDSYLSDFPCSDIELEMASELRDSIAAEMWNDHIRDSSNSRFDD